MDENYFVTTTRLLIKPLAKADDSFIFELVNTAGWIKFIGDRKITSPIEANAYIQKIIDNENVSYWIVILKDTQDKIGIVSYIKRDYLEYPDIGFAFLPNFYRNGYAYEATKAVLNELITRYNLQHILATTVPENISSIKLLQKIGFIFEKEIIVGENRLHVYGASPIITGEQTQLHSLHEVQTNTPNFTSPSGT